ncbi:MAG: hypothetical protein JW981_04930 [Anaerolineae bacterium]|nr:hypothetical protein [Anaerolineae bacterium]
MTDTEEEILYCHWHPEVETTLRCYQCNTPICPKCAQRTPVGYICPDCKKGRKRRFEQARNTDYIIAAVVSLLLAVPAGFILPQLGWFTVFLSPLAGGLIAEIVWRLVGRRYSEKLWWLVAGGIGLGALPFIILFGWQSLSGLNTGYAGGAIISLIWLIVHLVLTIGSATARLRLQ